MPDTLLTTLFWTCLILHLYTCAGLPQNYNNRDWKPPTEAPCLMDLLCEKHDGLVVEAKTIKEHWWKPHIKRLFERKVSCGEWESDCAVWFLHKMTVQTFCQVTVLFNNSFFFSCKMTVLFCFHITWLCCFVFLFCDKEVFHVLAFILLCLQSLIVSVF